jgi:rhamnosyltransferase
MPYSDSNFHACAIIITFNPGNSVVCNVKDLLLQFKEIFIIDNNSSSETIDFLTDQFSEITRASILRNSKNLGIAAAINQGMELAIRQNYVWAATFDQDSKIVEGYVSSMFKAYEEYKDKSKVAIISPRYFNKSINKLSAYADSYPVNTPDETNPLFEEVKLTMTSGNILNTMAFRAVGGCDEKLFIDLVDTELCLKYRLNSYKIIEAVDAILIHTPGIPSVHKFLGLHLSCYNHNAVRRYYKYRNKILVYKKYFFFDPSWVIQDVYPSLLEIAKIAIFEDQKRNKLLKILIGIWHGLLNVSGEYLGSPD